MSTENRIANVKENCEGKFLKVEAETDGTFTVTNARTGDAEDVREEIANLCVSAAKAAVEILLHWRRGLKPRPFKSIKLRGSGSLT